MTYLDWGCDPLTAECQSCLDAICNACSDECRDKGPGRGDPVGSGNDDRDTSGPDCERCDLEKKPECSRCEIILQVCRGCPEHHACDFRIS